MCDTGDTRLVRAPAVKVARRVRAARFVVHLDSPQPAPCAAPGAWGSWDKIMTYERASSVIRYHNTTGIDSD